MGQLYKRRWLLRYDKRRLLLALAGLIAVVGCGTPADQRDSGNTPRLAATATGGPTPSPADTAGTASRSCSTADLRLDVGDQIPEPTGQHTLSLVLTNKSVFGCSMFGYPTIALLDAGNQPLPLVYFETGDQVVTPHPPGRIDVQPGAHAYVTINKYRCDTATWASVSTVQLTPPGEARPIQAVLPPTAVILSYCGPGDPGSTVAVSPVAATLRETLSR